jgi:hypothetical protein
MAINLETPSSRRALLIASVGGVAAMVATALGRPLPARAADGDPIVAGGEYTSTSVTRITASGAAGAIEGFAASGTGIGGSSTSGTGVSATSESGSAVFAVSGSQTAAAIVGQGSTGVYGSGNRGVIADGLDSPGGIGLYCVAHPLGRALSVGGRAVFSRSGRAIVQAGKSYVDVDLNPKGGLGGSPLCFANLM